MVRHNIDKAIAVLRRAWPVLLETDTGVYRINPKAYVVHKNVLVPLQGYFVILNGVNEGFSVQEVVEPKLSVRGDMALRITKLLETPGRVLRASHEYDVLGKTLAVTYKTSPDIGAAAGEFSCNEYLEATAKLFPTFTEIPSLSIKVNRDGAISAHILLTELAPDQKT